MTHSEIKKGFKHKSLFCAICILLSFTVNAQNLNFTWAKTGGSSSAPESGHGIATDAQGNVYTTGFFYNTVDFNPDTSTFNLTSNGDADIYLQKLSSTGNLIWAISMGGSGEDYGNSLDVDSSGNVYITGYYHNSMDVDPGSGTTTLTSQGDQDVFLIKYNSLGQLVWARSIGGNDFEYGHGVSVAPDQSVLIGGEFQDTVDFDPGIGVTQRVSSGNTDAFTAKFTSGGALKWVRTFGSVFVDATRSVSADNMGNVYAIGEFHDTVDFDPGTGVTEFSSKGGRDIYIQKLDSNGAFQWAHHFGSGNNEWGNSVDVVDSIIYFTGSYKGIIDFDPGPDTMEFTSIFDWDAYVLSFKPSGELNWGKTFGGNSNETATSISADDSGSCYITGLFQGTVDFDPGSGTNNITTVGGGDVYINKLDKLGDFVEAFGFGGSSWEQGMGITSTADGYVYTTGYFQNTVDFDPGVDTFNITSIGSWDYFVHRMSPCNQFDQEVDTLMTCDSITWLDGNTYYADDSTASVTFKNQFGCDSVIDLRLQVNYSSFTIDNQQACDSYTWMDSVTYTNSTDTPSVYFTNSFGCDSLIQLDLIVHQSTQTTDVQLACDSLVWLDGNTYYNSTDTPLVSLQSTAGCDSVVRLDLTVTFINDSVTVWHNEFEAVESNGSYQWFKCDSGGSFTIIPNATNRRYVASDIGEFAVEVTKNGCSVMSGCYRAISSGIKEPDAKDIKIYPNPTRDHLTIEFERETRGQASIISIDGSAIFMTSEIHGRQQALDVSELPNGLYFIEIEYEGSVSRLRFVKQ